MLSTFCRSTLVREAARELMNVINRGRATRQVAKLTIDIDRKDSQILEL